MARTVPKAKAIEKKVHPRPLSLKESQKLLDDVLRRTPYAEGTLKAYRGYLRRAQDWLKDTCPAAHLAKVFDKPTSETPEYIALFITHEVAHRGLSWSTAQGIYSAFKHHFWYMNNGRYRADRWILRLGTTDECEGQPVKAVVVVDAMRALAVQVAERGGTRRHSRPMTREELTAIMAWSESECPPELMISYLTLEERLIATKHLYMRAWLSLGFYLWTRNFELSKLRHKDLDWNHRVADEPHVPHVRVTLEHRKGWTTRAREGRASKTAHCFNVYPNQSEPALDAHRHLQAWMEFLQQHHFGGRPFQNSSYLFPSFHVTSGTVYPNKEMTIGAVTSLLKEFVYGSGILTPPNGDDDDDHFPFSTHCLRRGGAQDALRRGWTLGQIGNWAEWRSKHMLIRYLINDTEESEADCSDLMSPSRRSALRKAPLVQIPTIVAAASSALATAPNSASSLLPYTSAPDVGRIPALVNHNGESLWKSAVRDWQEADETRGLYVPLSLWPKEAYAGGDGRKQFGSQYAQRRLIALEVLGPEFKGNERRFVKTYDADTITVTELLRRIRRAPKE